MQELIMRRSILTATALAASLATPAFAHDGDKPRIDDHAPIGVMADHYHKKGEWMASARYMTMGMGDPANTMMGPQDMDGTMIMVGGMYAVSDKLTLAAGLKYTGRSMEMVMMGNEMEREADGVGDLKLMAITPLFDNGSSRLLFSFGGTVPTGKTSETDHMGNLLPLKMQPGNDSWSLTPGLTYTRFGNGWSFGLQAKAAFWLDDASTAEKPGDSWQVTSWGSLTVTDNFSVSARLAYEDESAWRGVSPLSAGARERLRGFVGTNLYATGTHRIGVEFGFPIAESRGTNNMGTGTSLMVGWQKAF